MDTATAADAVSRPLPAFTTRPATRLQRLRIQRADTITALGFTGLAVYVMFNQWRQPATGYLTGSGQDQRMWEWFFALAAHSITNLNNPLGTLLQNHPQGVNLMANTSMFGVSVPLAPVTLLFGPTVTWTLVLTFGLASTAYAWYWFLGRYAVQSRAAAALGGLFCGFAPALISHANGHPNFVVLPLLPLILAAVIRLARGGDTRTARGGGTRTAVVLGLLVAMQIALGEEPLLITAVTFAVFTLAYFAFRPRFAVAAVRNATKPLLLAAGIALLLTAGPLWWQFFGPQSYRFIDHGPMGNDLKALLQFPRQSIGGSVSPGQNVAINGTEENSYFGWPLLVVVLASAIWLRRLALARAAAVTVVVLCVVSLGAELTVGRERTGVELPWSWLERLPLFESVLETRFAMGAIPAIALLLALTADRALREKVTRVPWAVAFALALVPLIPLPLTAVQRTPAPAFFADGTWRSYVDGGSVVTVPLPRPEDARALTWQVEADFGFPLAGGYFVGPVGPEKKAKYGPEDRPTALLLGSVQKEGTVPAVTDQMRAQAIADLTYWRADVLVLPNVDNQRALRRTVQSLLGIQAKRVDDVWLWDLRTVIRS